MRMHKNEVRFDTCGCYIQLQRDLDVPGSRMEFMHVIEKCPAHSHLSEAALWAACWTDANSEQHRKNDFYKALTVDDPLGIGAGLVEPITRQKQVRSEFFDRSVGVFDAAGQPVMETRYELIGGQNCYVWTFDANRCLCLCFDGCFLDATKKAALQAWCDTTWGANTVRVMNANDEA